MVFAKGGAGRLICVCAGKCAGGLLFACFASVFSGDFKENVDGILQDTGILGSSDVVCGKSAALFEHLLSDFSFLRKIIFSHF